MMRCSKIPYSTKKEAKTHLKTIDKSFFKGKPSYYICEKCNQWHVTSMTKAKRKSLNKILNNLGFQIGQIWEDENGGTLEIIELPKTLTGLGLWRCHFRLVNDKQEG